MLEYFIEEKRVREGKGILSVGLFEDFIGEKRSREKRGWVLLVERRNERMRRELILLEYCGRLFLKRKKRKVVRE